MDEGQETPIRRAEVLLQRRNGAATGRMDDLPGVHESESVVRGVRGVLREDPVSAAPGGGG